MYIPGVGLNNILVKDVLLPTTTINSANVRRFGPMFKQANDVIYEDLTIEFYNDGFFTIRKYFDDWKDRIFDPETATFDFRENYAEDILVVVMDYTGLVPALRINFESSYPIIVGDMQFSMAAENEISTLPITFTHKKFTTETLI